MMMSIAFVSLFCILHLVCCYASLKPIRVNADTPALARLHKISARQGLTRCPYGMQMMTCTMVTHKRSHRPLHNNTNGRCPANGPWSDMKAAKSYYPPNKSSWPRKKIRPPAKHELERLRQLRQQLRNELSVCPLYTCGIYINKCIDELIFADTACTIMQRNGRIDQCPRDELHTRYYI